MECAKNQDWRSPSGKSARHEEQGRNPFPILRELSTILEENKVRIAGSLSKASVESDRVFFYNRLDFKFLPSFDLLYACAQIVDIFFSISFTFDRNGSVMPMEHALGACLVH